MRRAFRGGHLLHDVAGAHVGQLPGLRPEAQGPRCGLHLHQGHGRHAHALPHRAHGESVQRRDRLAAAYSLPLRRRHGARQHPQGCRGRRGHRRHGPCAAGFRQLASRGRDDRGRFAGEPLRHGPRSRSPVRNRRVLGRGAQARALQARRVVPYPYAGVLPSGAGRHDVESALAARGAKRERPSARGDEGNSEGSRRGGLSAARHADVADRGHAGRVQRADRQALGRGVQGDEGLHLRLLWQGAGAHGQGHRGEGGGQFRDVAARRGARFARHHHVRPG